ncbi:MAG: tRNA pseudouridine(55) synthase TruB [Firmicutes bacterium HGW-Firmicutes-1]|jgi:tRNA pseudouridine55 synthase|nr:MAG: tRNA pseudouridine(55) synthase TruB [Firmicutes bacterium HGW-Firmicutes-1]
MKDGIINIYKEKDYTSFDVVAILRKKLHIKKIGHTGTLDPQAEGVLPICIGKATKAVDYLIDKEKTYAATMKLGQSTDTQDHTGTILESKEVHCSHEQITKAIESFIGPYSQIPPMYSAIKIGGKRLYDLAREGKTVERQARDIVFYDISDISIEGENVFLRVSCSKGTYIRTLCHDIGEVLGCGAHMTSLIREKSGDFEKQNSLKIDELDQLIADNKLEEKIMSVDRIFLDYPQVCVKEEFNKALYNGNKLKLAYLVQPIKLIVERQYRIYDEKDDFIGLYHCIKSEDDELILKPRTLFI